MLNIEELKMGTDTTNKLLVEIAKLMQVPSQKPPRRSSNDPAYNVMTYDLTIARTKEMPLEINLPGDALTFFTNGDLSNIEFRLDSPTNDWIVVGEFGNPYSYPAKFQEFYLSWLAMPGKYLRIHIGREAGAAAHVDITAAAPKVIFYDLASDKDNNFTLALLTGFKEDENLTGLLTNKVRVTGISIEAEQALNFWIMFWKSATFSNPDLNIDTFIGGVNLDLAGFGLRVDGAGQWYMSLEDVDLDYEDANRTNVLHVSLYNADAVAKIAGAAGAVKLVFRYEVRA